VRSLGAGHQFGPHLKVDQPSLVRPENNLGRHEEVEPAVETLARRILICHVQGRIVGFDKEGFHFHSDCQSW